ncbi:DUF805 domain-containing protein [Flagellimonas sp.]|uniref:DUF805 domain-containing protein n=1 Tax=Flagellimonas sp. TaxID=2058762 RepID=UPI003BAF85B0
MFQNPFSFEGRIRRLEYGISYVIYVLFYLIIILVWEEVLVGVAFFYLLLAAMVWFLVAQGAKRCHDLGTSGFFQFIPFYGILMLFQKGEDGVNKYGNNPKETAPPISESDVFTKPKSPNHSLGHNMLKISSPVLLNVFAAVILWEYLPISDFHLSLVLLVSSIPFYFLALLINYRGFALNANQKELFKERILYATIFFISIRLYTFCFRSTEIDIQLVFFEFILIAVFLGLTYIPYALYKIVFKKPSLEI